MTNTTATKIAIVKTDAGWTASSLPGETFQTRQAARDASKNAPAPAPAGWDKIEADDDEANTDEATEATDLAALIARLQAENTALRAQAVIADAMGSAEPVEVEIVMADVPSVQALPTGGRLTHYGAEALGLASDTIGARGHRKVRPAPKTGGIAHIRAARALRSLGLLVGDCISGRDAERIACAYLDAAGFQMSPRTVPVALDGWADAGWVSREGAGAGTRGNGYRIEPAMFAVLGEAEPAEEPATV